MLRECCRRTEGNLCPARIDLRAGGKEKKKHVLVRKQESTLPTVENKRPDNLTCHFFLTAGIMLCFQIWIPCPHCRERKTLS